MGRIFKITTFGESHGKALGVVIDGLPSGLIISEDDIFFELKYRRPGGIYTSTRKEEDYPIILSGIFNGKTTGMPISIIIENKDPKSIHYEEIKYKPRPGHADITYIEKYGYENWDYRGGGRSSGRETVSRVAAGAIAKKLLLLTDTIVAGYIKKAGTFNVDNTPEFNEILCSRDSPVRTIRNKEGELMKLIETLRKEGDSIGGIVEVVVKNPPKSLGEPVFDKLKADLAKSILSIPGVVGFEYGIGFDSYKFKGSEVMDEIYYDEKFRLRKNISGGILGGISTGEDIILRVAFKPTSSIAKEQKTIDLRDLKPTNLSIIGRHDPCIAIRGVSVVESMVAITLIDHYMLSGIIPRKLSKEQADIIEKRWSEYKQKCI
ncbi:chorismate synthase [Caldisphaera lagunensis DSM 15908]|uniref:Chorismate synthase n=1 Tax=Caldisphaera lagunensis (strain DSM 15908 / JCM 11604 / ANMR 0165 / IC-154) TaxID=1056495 RepID=L0A8Z8_CALLD|nr:chorismate synthase [Caldisphaera lagunensis]AFZ69899.1 chorismate synthase [Caldisphaera lagunensis DSM 15908]